MRSRLKLAPLSDPNCPSGVNELYLKEDAEKEGPEDQLLNVMKEFTIALESCEVDEKGEFTEDALQLLQGYEEQDTATGSTAISDVEDASESE